MINYFLLFIFIFVQNDGNEIISKLQNKFEQINYLSADFAQSVPGSNSLIGKFYFSKTNNYRIELQNNIIISDGITIWNHDINRKKVIISSVENDPLAFSLSEYIYNYPQKCKIKQDRIEEETVLILSEADSELNFETVKLWINNEFLITRIDVKDFGGNNYSLLFDKLIINEKIDDSKFKFKENSNLKVLDLR
jgi:outer membrane lipoprotein-sorting protein